MRRSLRDDSRWAQLNHTGASLFGTQWLAANELSRSLLDSFGIDPSEGRALGAAVALQVALASRYGKIPTATARTVESLATASAAKRQPEQDVEGR